MLNRQLDQKERPTNKLAFMKLDWRRRFGASRIIVRLRRVSIEHRAFRSLPRLIRHTSARDRLGRKKIKIYCAIPRCEIFTSCHLEENSVFIYIGYFISSPSDIHDGEMDPVYRNFLQYTEF